MERRLSASAQRSCRGIFFKAHKKTREFGEDLASDGELSPPGGQECAKKHLSPTKSRAQVCDIDDNITKSRSKIVRYPSIHSFDRGHSFIIHFPITALDLHATEHLRPWNWKRLKEPETFLTSWT